MIEMYDLPDEPEFLDDSNLDSPAADPWINIEPGCKMPEVGKRVLLLFPNGEVWLGSLYRHVDDWDAWQWHSDKDRSRGWTGFGSKGGPTHYAVVRMPPEETDTGCA